MTVSRRAFLQRIAAGAGAAALPPFPGVEKLFASSEPQRNPTVAGAIQLNSNENAYGPLPSAMKAMQEALSEGNRYPFARYQPLAESLAKHHGVGLDQVVLGAGSTEHLQMAARAFCGRGKSAVVADPTFESISEFVKAEGGEVRKVALTSNYAHDLDGMRQRVDANTGLVYICNPNNPTASITPAKDIEAFLGMLPASVVVLIDEAYFHFADGMNDYRSFLDHAEDRVIVMRTFSKVYGMAGIRLGYSISSVANAKKMAGFRLPISVSMIAAQGGLASLAADAEMRAAVLRNAVDRAEFAKQARARAIPLIPSYANFFMIKPARPAQEVIDGFLRHNILIGRPFPPMTDHVRVSLGVPAENQAFWEAWDRLYA